jgi:hypothetical protein
MILPLLTRRAAIWMHKLLMQAPGPLLLLRATDTGRLRAVCRPACCTAQTPTQDWSPAPTCRRAAAVRRCLAARLALVPPHREGGHRDARHHHAHNPRAHLPPAPGPLRFVTEGGRGGDCEVLCWQGECVVCTVQSAMRDGARSTQLQAQQAPRHRSATDCCRRSHYYPSAHNVHTHCTLTSWKLR